MSEFELIRRHFSTLTLPHARVVVGIGDDGAVVASEFDTELVVVMDVLNSGVHFPVDTQASDIGFKALAVNLSDLAAMGASPQWFTLGLSLPDSDEAWLADFCEGMAALANKHGIALIGGDTTRGPLSVAVTAGGSVPVGSAITRDGAKAGDLIAITGDLGGASLAFLDKDPDKPFDAATRARISLALNRPEPRVATGLALRPVVNACIDISDGLVQDLGHILQASAVGATLDLDAVPLAPDYRDRIAELGIERAITFGDDYELCCTLRPEQLEAVQRAAQAPIHIIGVIERKPGLRFTSQRGYSLPSEAGGFDHFR